MREADLQRHLSNGKDKEAAEKEAADKAAAAAKAKPAAPVPTDDASKKPIELGSKDDFQLMQAIAHLKGEPVKGQPPKTVADAAKVN